MKPNNVHIVHEHPSRTDADTDNPLDAIDLDKVRNVFIKGIPWVILIFLFTLSLSWLYLRYTKPLYSSESILKLDLKNEAGMLGLQNPLTQEIQGLSGEIEILKSRLFLSQVVDAIQMNVSYYHPGRSHLVDERYGNSPFEVKYLFIDPSLFDKRIDVNINTDDSFEINIPGIGKVTANFGDSIQNRMVNMKLVKSGNFDSQKKLENFYFVINSKNALVNYLQESLQVTPLNFNARTIKISLTDHNQNKARRLLWAIDTMYLEYSRKSKIQASEQKIEFLDQQMEKTAKELEAYETYFEDFTLKHRTTDLSSDLTKTITLINKLDSQRFFVKNQLTNIELLSGLIEDEKIVAISNIPSSLSQLITSYNGLIKERELKLGDYNENTQVIRGLNHQVQVTKNSALSALNSLKQNLVDSQEDLKKRKARLENNFEELPSMGTSYNKTQRLYDLQEEFYLSLIKTKIELEIAKAGTVTNFIILSPASYPNQPVHPKKFLIYGLGAVIGSVISIVFITISYLLHDKITSQKELEKLVSAPMLGVVPKYTGEKLDVTKLVVNTNPKSIISESLRTIRTNMDFLSTGKESQVISVTSTVSGEGKTFIAANLGAILAFSGKKVVIVDLDMRKPKVQMAFLADKKEIGVSTILIGKSKIDECIEKSSVEGLNFIQAGTTPPNPSELIMHKNFADFVDQLKSKFDTIILDTPPVGLVTDGILAMKLADLPIYVFRAEYSKKSFVKSIQSLISHNQFHNISVVLNGVRTNGRYGYGYGYGYGYSDVEEEPGLLKKISQKI